jgi:hypothetical protein
MRMRIAWALTGIWVLAAGSYIYLALPHIEGLDAVDVSALLSGAFMPLAFLWLVVGFFQQGAELRQNTEALRQQADRLEQQVQGTKSLVLVAVRQTEATVRMVQLERQKFEEEARNRSHAAQPRFVLDEGMRHPRAGSMRLHNVGAPASNLSIDTGNPAIKASIQPATFVQSGGFVNIHFEAPDYALLQATLGYFDAQGVARRISLRWAGDEVEVGMPELDAPEMPVTAPFSHPE